MHNCIQQGFIQRKELLIPSHVIQNAMCTMVGIFRTLFTQIYGFKVII